MRIIHLAADSKTLTLFGRREYMTFLQKVLVRIQAKVIFDQMDHRILHASSRRMLQNYCLRIIFVD